MVGGYILRRYHSARRRKALRLP